MKMSKAEPLVSVIISSYNHENYIKETLKSVIAQTYSRIELLISDDGSKDDTYKVIEAVLKENRKRFEYCYWFKHDNAGLPKSLNQLIDKSTGKYIFVMASDDIVKEHAIQTLVEFLESNPTYVLAVGDDEIIDENSKRIYWDKYMKAVPEEKAIFKTLGESLNTKKLSDENLFGEYSTLLKYNYIPNGYLIRTSVLRAIGKYNEDIIPEDWNLHLQLAKMGNFKFFNEILFSYRWHSCNTVKSKKYLKSTRDNRRKQLTLEKDWCESHERYKRHWNEYWRNEFGFFGTLRYFRKKIIKIHIRKGNLELEIFGEKVL